MAKKHDKIKAYGWSAVIASLILNLRIIWELSAPKAEAPASTGELAEWVYTFWRWPSQELKPDATAWQSSTPLSISVQPFSGPHIILKEWFTKTYGSLPTRLPRRQNYSEVNWRKANWIVTSWHHWLLKHTVRWDTSDKKMGKKR